GPPAPEQATATKPNDLDNGATEMAEPTTAATPEFMHTYAAGRTAWRNGQFAEAINQLNSALRMSPNHPAVLALMGRIHLQSLNQPARGVLFLEQAVAGDPTDVESLFLLGRSAWEQGQWDLAIVILAEVIDRASEPMDPGLLVLARHLLGAALERQGYDAAAIPQFTANLKQQSPFGRTSTYQRELQMLQRQKPRIWQGVGDLYMRQGQLADALEAYQRARDTMEDQDRPALTARWVYVNLRLGDMKQVAGALLEHLRSSPDDANALQLLKYARQYDVPRELLVPGLTDIYQTTGQPESLALVLAESLDTDEGQELLQDHLQHDPTAWRVFAKLLTLAMEADEKRAPPLLRSFEGNTGLRGALLTTARSIETTPRAASSYTQALLETVPAESVQQTAEKLRASGKAGAGMLYVLAQSAIRQKQWLAGEIALREALTMEPVIPAAALDLVRVLLAQKQWDAAGKVLAGITDETVEVTGLRVQWLSAQGQRDEALTLLDQALLKKPDDMELVVAKAMLLLQIGQANKVLEAQRLLLSAVETAPTQERLYQILFVIYDRQAVPNAQQQRVALLRKALQHIPGARLTRIKLVEEHLRSNDLREAQRLLENLLQEKADEPACGPTHAHHPAPPGETC
ncbi:MAG: tetratricopeptide repeat protein, partial [Phycisphaerales bacterium]|nr:tetratricopeptide repeat protein [Phycisphaerales bacterium]